MITIPKNHLLDVEYNLTSNQRTFDCPHCNIKSLHIRYQDILEYNSIARLKDKKGNDHISSAKMKHIIYQCVNCKQDTYFLVRGTIQEYEPMAHGPIIRAECPAEIIHQYPVSSPTIHPSVNKDVKLATIEAENCFSVRAFNACGVMARRAMHSICADKKAQGKDLYEQLKYLNDHNLITPDLWEWAEELRIVGRSGAHPEWEEVTKDDAEYALRFLREIIRYVYINPAERAARRLKETKKKKPQQ